MKIDNFSLYHIGIKLKPNVSISELRNLVENISVLENLKIVKKENNDTKNILPFEISIGTDEIAKKDETTILLNLPFRALNFTGKDPLQVSELFKKIMEQILASNQYEAESLVEMYEILCEANLSNGLSPLELLDKSIKININEVNKICSAKPYGIHLKGEGFDLVLEPQANRPSKILFTKIVRQTKDLDEVLEFPDKIITNITKIIDGKNE